MTRGRNKNGRPVRSIFSVPCMAANLRRHSTRVPRNYDHRRNVPVDHWVLFTYHSKLVRSCLLLLRIGAGFLILARPTSSSFLFSSAFARKFSMQKTDFQHFSALLIIRKTDSVQCKEPTDTNYYCLRGFVHDPELFFSSERKF